MAASLQRSEQVKIEGLLPKASAVPLPTLSRRALRVVSMFSGCGGMDLGFMGGFEFLGTRYPCLPFEIEWANDLNRAACRTYEQNLRGPIHCGDVWDFLDSLPHSADVLVGGFPCQDISINGKMKGVEGARSGLYRAMLAGIEKTKPRVFVAENVKGLLMKHSQDSLRQITDDFSALGYRVSVNLYLAADYGVPQMRERVFIVGVKDRTKKFRVPDPLRMNENWITAREALKDLELQQEEQSINHIWSRANVSPEQGNRILRADRPASTIRAECHGNIQFHYSLPRRISMREAARIQSFPNSFVFTGGLREIERQVGNAVPPVLAWHVANAVSGCFA